MTMTFQIGQKVDMFPMFKVDKPMGSKLRDRDDEDVDDELEKISLLLPFLPCLDNDGTYFMSKKRNKMVYSSMLHRCHICNVN